MSLLYYVANRTVKSVAWSEGRSRSVAGIFFPERIDALIQLKDVLESEAQDIITRIIEAEKEIHREKTEAQLG